VAAESGAEGEADDAASVDGIGNADGDESAADGDVRRVIKRRVPKRYRHPELDRALRRDRTVAEARLTSEARRAGVPTPLVCDVDVPAATLTLQYVGERDLAADLAERRTAAVGRHLARLHGAGVVHGDPTTRNVRIGGSAAGESGESAAGKSGESPGAAAGESPGAAERAATDGDARATLIDFGLAFHSGHVEDHAMDLHVFEGSVRATATDPDPLIEAFEAGYAEVGDDDVLDRLREVEGRGRYR
jgi:N6-L-threonylcarbamoyladenine synthase/protein kinase Bud32